MSGNPELNLLFFSLKVLKYLMYVGLCFGRCILSVDKSFKRDLLS